MPTMYAIISHLLYYTSCSYRFSPSLVDPEEGDRLVGGEGTLVGEGGSPVRQGAGRVEALKPSSSVEVKQATKRSQ